MTTCVENLKALAVKYGFKVVETAVGANLVCKDTQGEDCSWIEYDENRNMVTLVGNSDQCCLWFYETRPDLTPEKIVEFVKDLNAALEIKNPFLLRDLIDGEDWQEIANIHDAQEDPRWGENQI